MNEATTWQALDLAIAILEEMEENLSPENKDALDHLRDYRDFSKEEAHKLANSAANRKG